jgi:outer membrane protein OmpA-like peptidoglycan-associated protein
MQSFRSFFVVMLALAFVGGCATRTPGAPAPTPAAAPGSPQTGTPAHPPAPAATLASEQQRLAALFEGTPVVFAMQRDGSLKVEVPLRFSFDPGSSTVKPPLAAVLDRIATSQRRAGSRLLVVAPGDKRGKGITLGVDRAVSARDYLVGHGVSATRFAVSGVVEPDTIRIVVSENGPPRVH